MGRVCQCQSKNVQKRRQGFVFSNRVLMASVNDIDDDTLRRLHIRCVDEVKRINGVVKL